MTRTPPVHGYGVAYGPAARPRKPGQDEWQRVEVALSWRTSCLACGAPVTGSCLADVRVLAASLTVLGAPWMLLDMPDGCPECAHPVPGLSSFDGVLDGWECYTSAHDDAWLSKVRELTYGRRWADWGAAR